MTATLTKTWQKLARRMGCDGNPMRRRSDRVEAWLLPGAIATFFALCPVVAYGTSSVIHHENARAVQAAKSWQRVDAMLLRSAPGPQQTDNGANAWFVETMARWTFDGRQYTGDVPVLSNARAGAIVPILLNKQGQVEAPPLPQSQISNLDVEAILFALMLLALAVTGLTRLIHRALDRRRFAGWDSAWMEVAPRWRSQA
jgi:hypothetical protein